MPEAAPCGAEFMWDRFEDREGCVNRAHLAAIVVERGRAIGGLPGDRDVVPRAVGGGHASRVIAQLTLVLHHRDAPAFHPQMETE